MPNWQSTAIGAGITIVTLLLVAVWWWVPRLQMRGRTFWSQKDSADVEDNFRKTVGQALGGAAVLVGAGFGLFQFLQQQKTASEQQRMAADQFSQQQRTAHDLLISNQVSKGFEQFGSDKLVIRLGGIYALEGVMNTSEQYRVAVLEALCAFVRNSTSGGKRGFQPTADIQAILTVIGRRKPGLGNPDLSFADIRRADLRRADLRQANLHAAYLVGADLSNADLREADLRSAALLDYNEISSARTDGLQGADLRGADLRGTDLSFFDLSGGNLRGADFRGSYLSGTNLSGADLRDANFGGDYEADGITFLGRLNDANLSGADLRNVNLRGAQLQKVNLSGANLSNADLADSFELTQEQLDKACGQPRSLPPGLTLKPCHEDWISRKAPKESLNKLLSTR
jgi:uncharacterized protein YjbI with pentapeptide repeats